MNLTPKADLNPEHPPAGESRDYANHGTQVTTQHSKNR